MSYYAYKMMGYNEDELNYISVCDMYNIIDCVDKIRNELKSPYRREEDTRQKRPRFSEDLKYFIKYKSIKNREDIIGDIKERWKGIKGLDGSL